MSQPKHKPSHSERPLGRDCRTSDSTWMAGLGPSGSGASSGFASVGSGLGVGTGEGSLSEPSSSSFSARDSPGDFGGRSDLGLGTWGPGAASCSAFLDLGPGRWTIQGLSLLGQAGALLAAKLILPQITILLRVVPLGTWRTAVGRGRRILLRGVEEASSRRLFVPGVLGSTFTSPSLAGVLAAMFFMSSSASCTRSVFSVEHSPNTSRDCKPMQTKIGSASFPLQGPRARKLSQT